MRVHVCASPAGSAIHHTPTNLFILYKYKKLDWGCGCLGYAVGSLLLCHENNQLINRLEGAVKTAFYVPY